MIEQKKKVYEPPKVQRVHLDMTTAVLGTCQTSVTGLVAPTCNLVGTACPTH